MRLQNLKLGKSIEIIVTRGEYRLRLVSKIEDVQLDHIAVTLIVGGGRVFPFQDTDTIEFIYKDQERLWKFSNIKARVEKLDDTAVHCFYTISKGETYNRRNAFRVFVGEEINFFWVPKGHNDILHENKMNINEVDSPYLKKDCEGVIKDLSEGGAGIYTNERLELNDCVSFRLITEYGLIHCIGEVVRRTSVTEGNYRHFYGISFAEVSNVMSKYLFNLQRLHLQSSRK